MLCNVYCNTWRLKNLVSKCECVIYCYCSGNIIGVVMSCHYPSQCHVEDIYLFCILYPCPMSFVHCLSSSHLCSPDLFYKQCSPCLPLSGCCPTWSSNGFCCCCSDLFWFKNFALLTLLESFIYSCFYFFWNNSCYHLQPWVLHLGTTSTPIMTERLHHKWTQQTTSFKQHGWWCCAIFCLAAI